MSIYGVSMLALTILILVGVFHSLTSDLRERLAELQARLKEEVTTDPLTNLLNRRNFAERLQQEVSRARRYGRPISCVVLDIDHLRRVNEHHGVHAGNQVLTRVASDLKEVTRASDILGRVGGEEYIAILPETNLEQALMAAEKIRCAVEAQPVQVLEGAQVPITVSLGVASFSPEEVRKVGDGSQLLQMADDALKRAKEQGRNRVEAAPSCSPLLGLASVSYSNRLALH